MTGNNLSCNKETVSTSIIIIFSKIIDETDLLNALFQ